AGRGAVARAHHVDLPRDGDRRHVRHAGVFGDQNAVLAQGDVRGAAVLDLESPGELPGFPDGDFAFAPQSEGRSGLSAVGLDAHGTELADTDARVGEEDRL